jgi:chromate transport protein ChrA
LPIAVIVAAVVLASVVSIHMVMAALYGYEKRSIVQSDIGVYVVMVVVIIEICAGVFSRMKERQNN